MIKITDNNFYMEKIIISENDLKNLIKASFQDVILKENYQTRMDRRNRKYNDALANAQKYAKSWEEMTDPERQKFAADNPDYSYGTPQANYELEKKRAENKLARKTRRNGYALQAKNTDLINDLNAKLSQAQSLNTGYQNAIAQISNALGQQLAEGAGNVPSFDSSLAGAPAANVPTQDQKTAMQAKSAVPNLERILSSIVQIQNKVSQLTKANQKLTSMNNSLNQQLQNARNQTMANTMQASRTNTSQINAKTPISGKPAQVNLAARRPAVTPGTNNTAQA